LEEFFVGWAFLSGIFGGFCGFGLLLLLQKMKFATKLFHHLQLGRGGGKAFAFYNKIKYYGCSILKPI
jgi:hypothetical protein